LLLINGGGHNLSNFKERDEGIKSFIEQLH